MRRMDPVLVDAGSPLRRFDRRTNTPTPGMLLIARLHSPSTPRHARAAASRQCCTVSRYRAVHPRGQVASLMLRSRCWCVRCERELPCDEEPAMWQRQPDVISTDQKHQHSKPHSFVAVLQPACTFADAECSVVIRNPNICSEVKRTAASSSACGL